MLNPSWYVKPRMQDRIFEKKNTYLAALQNTMGHFGTRMTFGMSPETEKTINFCDRLSFTLSSFSAAPRVLLHIFSLLLPGTIIPSHLVH